MTYDEYKKAFEEIYALTTEIEKLCKHKKFEEVDEPFNKRNELFAKLSTPTEDLTEEKVRYILELRDRIKEKNDAILKMMQVQRNEIKKALAEINQESKIIDKYKMPTEPGKSSIFDFKE